MNEKERINKLKKIREKRNNLDSIDKNQKRKIEVIEYEDGTYSMIGFAWDLPLQKNEIKEAFKSWLNGDLEKEVDLKKLLN